jgi:8-oxo-dGTP diphosphatase
MMTYCVGLLFDDTQTYVCLIKKNRPTWQKGLLNGVGGHVEVGEAPSAAMAREFEEETGVRFSAWLPVLILQFHDAEVHFFTAADTAALRDTKTVTDEQVVLRRCRDTSQMLRNLPPIIKLSLQALEVHKTRSHQEKLS